MKNPSDPIGNETRDLPACSEVPKPSAPPRFLRVKIKCIDSKRNISDFLTATRVILLLRM